MVVFEDPLREDARPTVEGVLGGRGAGAEDIFGKPVALDDLTEKTGRNEDTNDNLT